MLSNFDEKNVIMDTSCLLAFAHIERISLLQELCTQLITTPEVAMEYQADLPPWIQVISV